MMNRTDNNHKVVRVCFTLCLLFLWNAASSSAQPDPGPTVRQGGGATTLSPSRPDGVENGTSNTTVTANTTVAPSQSSNDNEDSEKKEERQTLTPTSNLTSGNGGEEEQPTLAPTVDESQAQFQIPNDDVEDEDFPTMAPCMDQFNSTTSPTTNSNHTPGEIPIDEDIILTDAPSPSVTADDNITTPTFAPSALGTDSVSDVQSLDPTETVPVPTVAPTVNVGLVTTAPSVTVTTTSPSVVVTSIEDDIPTEGTLPLPRTPHHQFMIDNIIRPTSSGLPEKGDPINVETPPPEENDDDDDDDNVNATSTTTMESFRRIDDTFLEPQEAASAAGSIDQDLLYFEELSILLEEGTEQVNLWLSDSSSSVLQLLLETFEVTVQDYMMAFFTQHYPSLHYESTVHVVETTTGVQTTAANNDRSLRHGPRRLPPVSTTLSSADRRRRGATPTSDAVVGVIYNQVVVFRRSGLPLEFIDDSLTFLVTLPLQDDTRRKALADALRNNLYVALPLSTMSLKSVSSVQLP